MDKLTAICVFISVAQTGSFTKTAAALGISKPMISRHIALLEEWTGARLLQRTTRKVSLTEAGEQALVFCQKIADTANQMEQEMAAHLGDLRGSIRLSANTSFGTLHLAPAIHAFLRTHPNVSIDLHLSDTISDLIAERMDLAIRVTSTPEAGFIARKLADCHSLIVASSEYLARNAAPQTPQDLHAHRCLAHANINRRLWHFFQDGRPHTVEITSKFTSNDTAALLSAVLAGDGIAMLPRYMLSDHLQTSRLHVLLTDYQLPKFELFIIYPTREKQPLVVKALIEFLIENFRGRDW